LDASFSIVVPYGFHGPPQTLRPSSLLVFPNFLCVS